MTTRNLLIIHSSNEMYGSDQVLLRTATALRTAGWIPRVLLPNDLAYTGELSRELVRLRIPVRIMSLGILRRKYLQPWNVPGYLWILMRAILAVRRIIRTENIGLVYSATGAVMCGAFAAALTRTAHAWHIHEIIERPRWMAKLLSGVYSGFSQRLIAVSQAVRDHWVGLNSGLRGKMQVIHNGVDLDYFSPTGQRAGMRRQMGLKPQTVLLGCLGRIGTWKGQEVLLQALGRLKADPRRLQLLIAGGTLPGEAGKLQLIRQQIDRLGLQRNVIIQDFQQDVRPLLEALDVVVVPSVKPEPFGMVILEAMAFGLPVIASNTGGSPEVVVNGVTGYLVPSSDPQALADAISAIIQSTQRRREFGRTGRKRVSKTFSLLQYQKKVVAFFADADFKNF